MVSEPHDVIRRLFTIALVIAGSAWGSYVLVHAVITGDQKDPAPTALGVYRQLLLKSGFLIFSNIVLTVFVGFLLFHLLWYRQVEFVSDADCLLSWQRDDDVQVPLGILRAMQPTHIRVPLWAQAFVTKPIYGDGALHPKFVKIPPAWRSLDEVRLPVECKPVST
ncbi:hypothetical protein SAMN05216486_1035 [bacterium JGI 053]|nr:hypothetical protein SAMN05216486_1035 [bacterium JGI 053]